MYPRIIYIAFGRFLVVRLPKIPVSKALNDYGGHNRPISSSPVNEFCFLPTIILGSVHQPQFFWVKSSARTSDMMQSRNGFSLMSEPDRLSIGSAASLGSTRKHLALLRNVWVGGRHKHMTQAPVRHIRWKTDYNWMLCGLTF